MDICALKGNQCIVGWFALFTTEQTNQPPQILRESANG
jgi:hypothetical protein